MKKKKVKKTPKKPEYKGGLYLPGDPRKPKWVPPSIQAEQW